MVPPETPLGWAEKREIIQLHGVFYGDLGNIENDLRTKSHHKIRCFAIPHDLFGGYKRLGTSSTFFPPNIRLVLFGAPLQVVVQQGGIATVGVVLLLNRQGNLPRNTWAITPAKLVIYYPPVN